METLYDTDAAAEALKVSPRTMERWRQEGRGPAYRKCGRAARYTERDLNDYLEAQRRTGTTSGQAGQTA